MTKGDVIRLPCGASGFPRPTFAWFKDGGRLSNAHDRFTVRVENSRYELDPMFNIMFLMADHVRRHVGDRERAAGRLRALPLLGHQLPRAGELGGQGEGQPAPAGR